GRAEAGVPRRALDPPSETLEPCLGTSAADRKLARAVPRELEQLRDPRLPQAPPSRPELEPDRRREREARLCEDGAQLLFRDGDPLDLDGKRRLGAGER